MEFSAARLNHYFVPSLSNNHRARFLHPPILSLLVALFLTSQFFLNYFGFFFPRVLGYAANISPDRLIELTNRERATRGLAPLENNSLLNEAARRKAGDMFSLDYWAHFSPTGRSPWAFFKETGYHYLFAGENLARDFNDSESVVAAWMESPSHRDNILGQDYEEIGIAVVDGQLEGLETTLIVQLFGSPLSDSSVSVEAKEARQSLIGPVLASGQATSSAEAIHPATAGIQEKRALPSLFNPFSLTKTMVIFLISLILGILLLDLVLVAQKRLVRLGGRSLAHLTFLLFILLAILSTQPGLIL
ncbi:MAG: hypothetical protein JW991_04045 [Candidatus Pacebacteria bacterium]|nr:hypothetical protein [Candidatus Paceibacterota bacterium]